MLQSNPSLAAGVVPTALMCALTITNLASQGRTLRIGFPAWAAEVECLLEDEVRSEALPRAAAIRLDCSRPGALRCSFVGAEPIDIRVEDACRTGALPLRQAKELVLRTATAASLEVEWLEVRHPAEARVLATRTVLPDRAASLFVAPRRERLMRFRRTGVSPVSVSSDVLQQQSWTLPDPSPGGELVAIIADATVLPQFYRLSGPRAVQLVPKPNATIAVQGIPPGDYNITPVYHAELIEGVPQRVRVLDAESTIVFLGRESVGGLDMFADDYVCGQTSHLRLVRIDTALHRQQGASVTTRRGVLEMPHEGHCIREITGLRPGRYELSLAHNGRTVVKDEVDIAEQALSSIRFAGLRTHVSGRVSFREKPLEGAVVEFRPVDHDASLAVVSAAADEWGMYRVHLPKAGKYLATLRGKRRLFSHTRELAVSEGSNSLDWDIDSSTLAVRITGWNSGTPIRLVVRRVEPFRSGEFELSTNIEPHEAEQTLIEELEPGKYTVQAVQLPTVREGRRRVSAPATVSISPEQDVVTIVLSLAEYEPTLVLRDPQGRPVTDAVVGHLETLRAPEISPGTYSLHGARPGSKVFVKARGFTPSCRLAPAAGAEDNKRLGHTLTRGRSVDVEFTGPRGLSVPPGLIMWAAIDCPVGLDMFTFTASPAASENNVTRFLIEDFPSVGRFTYIPPFSTSTAQWQEIFLPGGTLQIALPPMLPVRE